MHYSYAQTLAHDIMMPLPQVYPAGTLREDRAAELLYTRMLPFFTSKPCVAFSSGQYAMSVDWRPASQVHTALTTEVYKD